jgi:hypothetical protein
MRGRDNTRARKIIAVTERSIRYDILPRVRTIELVLEGEGSRVFAGDPIRPPTATGD